MASAEKGEKLRRLVHILTFSFIFYYWIPDIIFDLHKEYLLVIFLAVVLFVDSYRMHVGWRVYGAREYEHNRPSALALVAIGVTVGLLFFPKHLVVPAILTMAFVDPVIRNVREREGLIYPVLPLCMSIGIYYFSFDYLTDWSLMYAMALALLGGMVAIAVERPHIEFLDDDLLILLVPTIILYLVS